MSASDTTPHVPASDVLAGLDPEQRHAAETLLGPVCILAGAGTGKTRAITHRIAHGIQEGVYTSGSLLALTFTSKAAGELRHRLRALNAPGAVVRTFHAEALSQVGFFWPDLVGGSAPRLLDNKARYIAEAGERAKIRLGPGAVREIAGEIEWRKTSELSIERYVSAARERPLPRGLDADAVAEVQQQYEDIKDERRRIDFEDVLLLASGLLDSEVIALEPQQVGARGTGEGVDRLVRVADDAEVGAVAEPQLQQPVLEGRDVLELVDHEVPVLRAHPLPGDVLGVEQTGGEQQHVLEVDATALVLDLLVLVLDLGDGVGIQSSREGTLARRRAVALDAQLRRLAPLDLTGDLAHRTRTESDLRPLPRLGDVPRLVVEQPRRRTADEVGPEVPELRERLGVEGAHHGPRRAEHPQAVPQFARGLRGEGEREHRAGRVDALLDAVGDPVRDGAGLAGSGAGEDADRSEERLGGVPLFGVESVEQAGAHRNVTPTGGLRRRSLPRTSAR